MKIVNVIALVFGLVQLIVCGYFIVEVTDIRTPFFGISSTVNYELIRSAVASATIQAVLLMVIISLFYLCFYIINRRKIKAKAARISTSIGLVLFILITLWSILVLSAPNHISFDEGGYVWVVYAIINLCLFSVLLIQSFKLSRQNISLITDDSIIDSDLVNS